MWRLRYVALRYVATSHYYHRVILDHYLLHCLRSHPFVISIVVYITALIKIKENFLICKEIQKGAVAKSYAVSPTASSYMTKICVFPHILGSPSSYMTLQLLPSKFPYIWGKFFAISVCWSVFKFSLPSSDPIIFICQFRSPRPFLLSKVGQSLSFAL